VNGMGIHSPRNGLSLCAGAGGLDMGLQLAEPGLHTRVWVEIEPEPRKRIIAAQQAGYFTPAPIWDDLTTFDGRELRGCIDTILAGYPCQPFSAAGQRRGEADERHLWPHVARIIREVQPTWVFLENVAGHVSLGAEAVLRELREMGYTAAAGLFSAQEVGAPHERLRWFCVAYKPGGGCRIGGHAAQQGRGGYVDSSDCDMDDPAHSDRGIHPRPGGKGIGAAHDRGASGDVDDACSQRRQQVAGSAHGDESAHEGRTAPDCDQFAGSDKDVDNTASPRCDAAGIGPATDSEGGQCLSGAGCDDMADTERHAGHEGRCRFGDNQSPRVFGQADRTGAQVTPIFPPGPAADEQWAAIMASSPDLSPSFARRDVLAATVNIAALLSPDKAEAIESRLRSIPRGAGMAAVVEQAPELVGQAQALTGLRNVADGLADRTRALRILGNGVVPLSAAYAWRTLAASHGLMPVDLGAASETAGTTPDEPVRRGVA
jgi:site-specific DNA-cytosine methylase